MFHLEIARTEIEKFKNDRMLDKLIPENELKALAKLALITAMIREVQVEFAAIDEENELAN